MSIDIDTLVKRSARLKVEDLDLNAFSDQPLDPDTLRCLRYMHDVENHTVCYLRDLLVTRAHRDPEVTAFLTCWNYEEHWHGDAIGQVLDAHGEVAGRSRLSEMRSRLPKRDALRPMMFHFTSAVTRHLTALQMTWGAVNEWTTQAGYARLAVKADNPVLGELLRRIMRQEGRHIDFYAAQAKSRLADSRTAQRLTRAALRRLWAPVGSGVMPTDETRFLVGHLFSDDGGLATAKRPSRPAHRSPPPELAEASISSRSPWPSWPRNPEELTTKKGGTPWWRRFSVWMV